MVECHPLEPFCPTNAKILMLGSFPPPKKRWSMDFFYPNFQNDMWRIMSLIFTEKKDTFVDIENKTFKKEEIISYLNKYGIALYDAAVSVRRLQDNASDKFLQIIEPTNIQKIMEEKLPQCHTIVSTGQKSTEILSSEFSFQVPKMGESVTFSIGDRQLKFYRMPSTSRAYPLSIEKKAEFYRAMFKEVNLM